MAFQKKKQVLSGHIFCPDIWPAEELFRVRRQTQEMSDKELSPQWQNYPNLRTF